MTVIRKEGDGMATDDKKKKDNSVEVASDARKDPRGQTAGDTPQPQVAHGAEQDLALGGDTKAEVNPELDTLSVSIPTGVNEDGTTEFDKFMKGKQYDVDASLLEVKNTENQFLLVAVNNEEGGE